MTVRDAVAAGGRHLREATRVGRLTLVVGGLTTVAAFFGWLDASEITAASNGLWMGVSGGAALLAHVVLHRQHETLTAAARQVARGIRQTGACVALHRLWWNIGIWMRPEDALYWDVTTDHRWVTVLLVVLIAQGAQKGSRPIVRRYTRGRRAEVVEGGLVGLAVLSAIPA